MTLIFVPILRRQVQKGTVLGAFVSDQLVGVTGMVPPGRCQPTLAEKIVVLPALLRGCGVRNSLRVFEWIGDWARHDPSTPHWHLGPVAVDRHLQGQGIGGVLLREFCRRVDDHAAAAYLETDKPENVTFYRRVAFEVVDEHDVLGVRNWFMIRHVRGEAPRSSLE